MGKIAPDFHKKGRISVGADADITIKVIYYELVCEKIVKDKNVVNKSVRNGKPIRSKYNNGN